MCLSLLPREDLIPQGNVLILIQRMYLSSFLGITKFLPSKKLTIRLPLNQGPLAGMVRHPTAHEEFLSSDVMDLDIEEYSTFSFIGYRSSITFFLSHVSC